MTSARSTLCAVVSDIHFPHHHRAAWEAFVAWCADHRPRRVVINGDVLDFESLSRFEKSPENVSAIDEIKVMVRECNRLVQHVGKLDIQEGNHDERWGGIIAQHAIHLGDAIGLSLQEQCRFQGLDAGIGWIREDVKTLGTQIGPFRIRHGHKQSKGFGPMHIAATRLRKSMGEWEIVGHHHRAQLYAQTAFGKQAVAIANPSMTAPHNYAPGADWQTGFTVVECFGPDATAYPIVMTLDGRFAWGGKVYGAKAKGPTVGAVEPPGSATRVEHSTGADVSSLDFDDVPQTAISRPDDDAPNTVWARYLGMSEKWVRTQRERGIPPSLWQPKQQRSA